MEVEALLLAACGVDVVDADVDLSPIAAAAAELEAAEAAPEIRSEAARCCCSLSPDAEEEEEERSFAEEEEDEEVAADSIRVSNAASPAGTLPRLFTLFNDGDR